MEYERIERLAKRVGVKPETVKNNPYLKNQIKIKNGDKVLRDDSRYPFKMNSRYKKSLETRQYCILKSLYEYRYVDEDMLDLNKSDYNDIIGRLLKYRFIKKINDNPFGTNCYAIDEEGIAFMHKYKDAKIQKAADYLAQMILTIAEAGGKFIGGIVSTL